MTVETRLRDVEEVLRLLRDANRLQGRPLSAAQPSDNELIGWNATTKKWEPKAPTILTARGTSDLTLTTSAQSIVGDGDSSKVRVLLPSIGKWLIIGTFDFEVAVTDPDACHGELYVDDSGSEETGRALYWPGGPGANLTGRAVVSQTWPVTTTAADIPVELKAKKNTDAGTAKAKSSSTTIVAIGIAGGMTVAAPTSHSALDDLGATADHLWALLVDGTRAFSGEQSMGTNKLTNVVDPTANQDAATKKYVDDNDHLQAHGPSQHTEGTAWRQNYYGANGDEAVIGFQLPGSATLADSYYRSAGTAAAPGFSQIVLAKSITVEDPTNAEDITICFFHLAVTIREIEAVVVGSSTPSVTINPKHHADRSNAGNALLSGATAITNTTTGQTLTSWTDNTIPSDSFLWLETTLKSGTVDELHLTIRYTID